MADNTIRDQLAADIWRYDDYIDYAVSGCTQRDSERLAGHLLTKGYRPAARRIETPEQLDALGFPCVIREIPAEDEIEFYPQIWEKPFQTDGWCRAGAVWRETYCTPKLPVEVLVEPEVDR
ncbi:hypothetical protein [Nocardia sp. NPDC004860]|uniref:hypothetical protein n=1 Tax=Nocardia sp. NPDC004860 TaxID=3154557 RepID=UPI0033B8B05A